MYVQVFRPVMSGQLNEVNIMMVRNLSRESLFQCCRVSISDGSDISGDNYGDSTNTNGAGIL